MMVSLPFGAVKGKNNLRGAKSSGPIPKPRTKRVMERKIAMLPTPKASAWDGMSPVGMDDPRATARQRKEHDRVEYLRVRRCYPNSFLRRHSPLLSLAPFARVLACSGLKVDNDTSSSLLGIRGLAVVSDHCRNGAVCLDILVTEDLLLGVGEDGGPCELSFYWFNHSRGLDVCVVCSVGTGV